MEDVQPILVDKGLVVRDVVLGLVEVDTLCLVVGGIEDKISGARNREGVRGWLF